MVRRPLSILLAVARILTLISYNVFPHFDGSLSGLRPRFRACCFSKKLRCGDFEYYTRQRDSLQSVLKNYGYDGVRSPKKKFLIGEINIPRKPLGEINFGSDEVQKNFIMKSYVTAATNGILQMNIKSIAEESKFAEATDGSQVMGLYQKLTTTPYDRTPNIEGYAFKTTSELLFSLTYDSMRTRLLNLPPSVRGAAFKNNANKYTYVLWGKSNR